MRDPYAVLGVSKGASAVDIRKAYKKLARKHHPDVAKTEEDAEAFKEINAAYDILGDDEKRKLFDEFGEVSVRPGFDAEQARAWSRQGMGGRGGGMGGGPGGFRWSSEGPDLSGGFGGGGFGGGFGGDPDDILGSLFGGGRVRRGPRPGQDIKADVAVSLLDVARDLPIEIELRRPVAGPPGPGGQATMSLQSEKIKLRLPPGVEDGRTIRLRGKGGDSPSGGPAGDLLITVKVNEVPGLRREGDALELEVPISFAEALGGGRITVPTLDGEVKVTVPAGVQSGQKLRLRGKGMSLAQGRGDLILVLRPTSPPEGGPPDPELVAKLEALYTADLRANLPL